MDLEAGKLKTLFPFAGPILVFLGVVRLHLYYRAFNVHIVNFLDFSEIVTAFLEDLIFLVGGALIVFLLDFLATTEREIESKGKFSKAFLEESSAPKRAMMSIKRMIPFMGPVDLGLLVLLIVALVKRQDLTHLLWSVFWFHLSFVLVHTLFEVRRKYVQFYGKQLDSTYSNLLLFSLLSVSILIQQVQSDIMSVREGKRYAGVSFSIDGAKIASDSLHYYIGNTRNYLFFYDQSSHKSTVYPMSRVADITFGQ